MRAGILARVSTEGQAGAEHHSLPVQMEQMRRLAERNGWQVSAVFEIPGESAYTDEIERRPEFDAAIRAAERGEFEVLIVYDFSRFARNQYLAHATLRRLRKAGVRLFGSNGIDYTADEDMAGMEAIFAARASRDHARRVSHAIDRRHLMGLPTGDLPFGYGRGESALVPPVVVPEEAEAVRWAYRQFLVAGSYLEIARELNRRGLRPHSKRRRVGNTGIVRPPNEEFTVTGIQRILENPFYLGFVLHKGERREGLHEAIVDADLFAAVQERKRRGQRAPKSHALLSGISVCAVCGRGLWCERSGSYRYYGERARGLLKECENARVRWRADEADAVIGQVVSAIRLDGDWLAYVESKARKPVRASKALREKLAERRRRLTNAYVAGGLADGEYRARLAEVDAEERSVGPDVDSVLFAGERITSVAGVWEVASEGERGEIVRTLLRSVRVDTAGKEMGLEPWPEYEGLFALRREFVGVLRPGGAGDLLVHKPESGPSKSRTFLVHASGLYLPSELGLAS